MKVNAPYYWFFLVRIEFYVSLSLWGEKILDSIWIAKKFSLEIGDIGGLQVKDI